MQRNPDPIIKGLRRAGQHGFARMVEKRRCGDCTVCCVVKSVPGVTEAHIPCAHLRGPGEPAGCGIYKAAPRSCRVFFCGWRAGIGGPADRPDRAGFFLDAEPLKNAAGDDTAGLVVRIFAAFDVEAVLRACTTAFDIYGWPYFAVAAPWCKEGEKIPFFPFGRLGELRAVLVAVHARLEEQEQSQ